MDRLAAEQARRNELTREAWDTYASHRRIVTELIAAAGGAGQQRLCVLGAGNANDLDLVVLAERFAEIHLVDLDAAALAAGVSRSEVHPAAQITTHGGVDLTGVLSTLAGWTEAPTDDGITDCIRAIREYNPISLPGPFDVVASTCLLTQIIEAVVNTLGTSHPRLLDLLLAVRDAHLRQLLELTAPGGTVVLVSDFVSSDTCAELARVTDTDLPALVAQLIAQHNFFTGANPQVLRNWFQSEQIAPLVAGVRLVGPWRWNLGPRAFAVCAVIVERKTG